MFKKRRARYVIEKLKDKKYPKKPKKDIQISDITNGYKTTKILNKETKITTIGSCFAEELRLWLNQNKYNISNPMWGQVYNIKNIKQIFKFSLEPNTWNPKEVVWDFDGDIRHPYIKGPQLEPYKLGNKNNYIRNMNDLHDSFSKVLKEINVIIITLGQTEFWGNKDDKYAFYAAPWINIKDGEKNHKFFNLSVEEVKEELRDSIKILKKHNPNIKIIISVSPVPLVASGQQKLSGFILANKAKSCQHIATLEVIDEFKNVQYMPSYEIVNSDLIGSYENDGRHIKRTKVKSIMDTFEKLFCYE